MVEHASHVIHGEFGSEHEQALVKEVFVVQRQAPDVEVILPSRRYRSVHGNRLLCAVRDAEPGKLNAMRTELFRRLWQRDENIDSMDVLKDALRTHDLSPSLLDSCHEEQPKQLEEQRRWEDADIDACVPVILHRNPARKLIGLSSEAELAEFFLDEKSRDISSLACFYQRKPTVLVLGLMRNLWPILRTLREHCDVVLAPRASELQSLLTGDCPIDLLLVDWKSVPGDMLAHLAISARTHSFPWVVATHNPSPDEEQRVLSAGAAEYLPIDGSSDLAIMRLNRILRDRVTVRRRAEDSMTDRQTGVATRRHFSERYEREWERGVRTEGVISLIDAAVDDFKTFNDIHGYWHGDAFLSTLVASWSTLLVGENQLLARLAPDKFLVMLPRVEEAEAKAFGERMRHAALRSSTREQAQAWLLTLSVGVSSVIPRHGQSLYSLIDNAAEAREQARALGGNQLCVI
jgi:diguanylate cyclase (GGDEF)-like protein